MKNSQDVNRAGVELAIQTAGGTSALARICGVAPQAVSLWRRQGWIPPLRVRQVYEGLGKRVPLKKLSAIYA